MGFSIDVDDANGKEVYSYAFVGYYTYKDVWGPACKELSLELVQQFGYLEVNSQNYEALVAELLLLRNWLTAHNKEVEGLDKLVSALRQYVKAGHDVLIGG